MGQQAICITEHGNLYNWIEKKIYCDKNGIKYLHGVECYLTESHSEKIRDNFHTILIAKNYAGVLELNQLMSNSENYLRMIDPESADHFYYKNRISFEEFLHISNNIIKISACLASPLNKLNVSHPYYEKLVQQYDYLEIQPHIHSQDQINFNRHLLMLSEKYHKPLIAGTDTHSIDKYKAECRSILQTAKHIEYSSEDAFDLSYKSFDELVQMFREQDAIPEKVWLGAIENTNLMAESIEAFELDKSFKYPKLYGSSAEDKKVFVQTIRKKFNCKVNEGIIKKDTVLSFQKNINEECRVFDKIDMAGFMLFMSEMITWCKENGIPVGFNRGSCGGSRVAYVTDITDLNPEEWKTVFSRFCNEDRKEIGDIDIDVSPSDRDKVYNYIIERFGKPYTAYILAIGTVSSKGTIDEIGRALSIRWQKQNLIDEKSIRDQIKELRNQPQSEDYQKQLSNLTEKLGEAKRENQKIILSDPYALEKIVQVKKGFEADEQKARKQYPDIFYYFDGLVNTPISQSMHPAGIIASPVTLADNYGVFVRDDKIILQIDMECVHEVSLVKYDILGLKNVEIIKDTYQLLGKPYPKSHEINWMDEAVWKDMLRSPVGIFQFEGDFAHSMLRQYEPHSIFDMSLVTAALRPSGASYRKQLMEHQPNKNPSKLIDDLLADNNGYLIYQEDVIKFLTEICGFSGSDADNTRRAIGRKDEERLKNALPDILEGYCGKSDRSRTEAEEEAKTFLKIIEDASSYMFGYNHSVGYCMIGYLCAYLRYYHPHEFITAYLNNANNEDDIKNGSALANEYRIRIVSPQYGLSRSRYMSDKEKSVISKGVGSIKFLNDAVAEELYTLSQQSNTGSFVDLLLEIAQKTSVNSRQRDILIKLDYFRSFGNAKELLRVVKIFEFFKEGTAKKISKDKMKDSPLYLVVPRFATDIMKNGKPGKSYVITDIVGLLNECERSVREEKVQDFTYREKMADQMEYLGYVDLVTGVEEDRRKLLITDTIPLKSKDTGLPWAYIVLTRSIGSGKESRLTVMAKVFESDPLKKMDIIFAKTVEKNRKGYWYLYDYQKIVS